MSPRQDRAFFLTLLALVTASWVILFWQSRSAQGMGGGMGNGLTMGMGAILFLAIWVIMMVAMMFPSAVPVIPAPC
jgi:predicted metal-binding membrane protein